MGRETFWGPLRVLRIVHDSYTEDRGLGREFKKQTKMVSFCIWMVDNFPSMSSFVKYHKVEVLVSGCSNPYRNKMSIHSACLQSFKDFQSVDC